MPVPIERKWIKTGGKPVKLDKKDKKILSILKQNARMPTSEISKKVGLSREVTAYRIKRLEQEEVITKYYTIINPAKIGYRVYWILVSLWNLTKKREKEFQKHLYELPYVVYFNKPAGRWDYIIETFAPDIEEFEENRTKLRDKFSDIIKEAEGLPIIADYKWDPVPF